MNNNNGRFKEFTDEVRAKINLVDLIASDGHRFEKSGRGHKCLSPFRKEKTASFFVFPDQKFHDFGDDTSGDCFTYVMLRENIEFGKEVVAICARFANLIPYWDEFQATPLDVDLEELKAATEERGVRERLTEAAEYFHHAMNSRLRKIVRDTWGISDEQIDFYKIGYADGSLAIHFRQEKGYSVNACARTGLFILAGQENLLDFYDSRFVFPYWKNGHVVYMIGRRTEFSSDKDYEKAKYKKLLTHSEKNSYVSRSIRNDWFYGEDVCDKKLDRLFITEGVTDCIMANQFEFACISPVTTRFKQATFPRLLECAKSAKKIYVCNDVDELADGKKPGEAGALATALYFFKHGIVMNIVTLPKPKEATKIDLAEFLRDNGAAAFEKVIAESKEFPDYVMTQIVAEGLPPAELEQRLDFIFEMIAANPSDVQREEYTKRAAKKFQLKPATIEKHVKAARNVDAKEEAKKAEVAAEKTESSSEGSEKTEAPSKKSKKSALTADRIRGEIEADLYYYYVTIAGVDEIISSFVLRPKKAVYVNDKILLTCDIDTAKGTIKDYTFPSAAWTGKREFLKAISWNPDLQWTGNDEEVQGILRLVMAQKVPSQLGTTNLGYHDGPKGRRWVFPGGIIDENGIQREPDLVYVPVGASIAQRIQYEQTESDEIKELAKKVLPLLPELNKHEVSAVVMAWFFATPFKPRIQSVLSHFPILFIFGTHGSGKSSILRDIFWRLFGIVHRTDPYSCTETEFALVRLFSSTNSVPICLDEFKPRDMGRVRVERITRFLRRAYGGETEERGRTDLTTVAFHLTAPIAIAGEAAPDDPAMGERILPVRPDKNYLVMSESAKRAFRTLKNLPIHKLAPAYIQWSLRQDVPLAIQESRVVLTEVLRRAQRVIEPRVYDNLLVMMVGLQMFDAWAAELGVETPEIDPVALVRCLVDDVLDGGDGGTVKDAFDAFLVELSTYAQLRILEEDRHYAYINDKLCICLPACYQIYLIERKKAGLEDDTNGLRALRRVAKEKMERLSYILDLDKRVALNGHFTRCLEIDPDRIPSALHYESFPNKNRRTWGRKNFGNDSSGENGPN